MRKINNKEIELPNVKVVWEKTQITNASVITEKTAYFKLFKLAAETPPKDGWNTVGATTFKARLDLISKIDVGKTDILLEESEYELLSTCVKDNIVIHSTSQDAYDFLNYLAGVQKEEVS